MIILHETTEAQTLYLTPNANLDTTISDVMFSFKESASDIVNDITGSIVPENYYGTAELTLDFLKAGQEYELTLTKNDETLLKTQVEVLGEGETPTTYKLSDNQFVVFEDDSGNTKPIFDE